VQSTTHTAVLIVGGGPVGLALANDLGWRGVPCLLVEQTDGSIYQPKMDGVNIRTMEFCRRWGMVDAIHACPYPSDYPQDMVYLTSLAGYELGRESFLKPQTGSEAAAPSPESRVRCPQNLFDPILRRAALSWDSVELRYGCRFLDLTETSAGVQARLEDLALGERYQVAAEYLVGCDGGASKVRAAIGLDMQGLGSLTFTTNVIVRCADLPALHQTRLAYRHIFIGTEGTWSTMVAINGRDEWRFSFIGSGEPRSLSEDEIRALIGRAAGFDFSYEIVSIVPWVRRELVAQSYGTQRVFLAGDAAHVMSPTGGFGMNTGIGDAVDLGWKLSAALSGWAGSDLLATYDLERRPVGQRAAREASGNLRRMLSPGSNPALLDRSTAGARVRYEVGRRFSATMLREWYTHGIGLGYVYEASPISTAQAAGDVPKRTFSRDELRAHSPAPGGWFADGAPIGAGNLRDWQRLCVHRSDGYDVAPPWEELPAEEVMLYRPSARPGARAPHVWLDDGTSTLDHFGRSYHCLLLGPAPPDAGPLIEAARSRNVPLSVSRLAEPAVFTAYEAPLVLVRPDGHVAWRGGTFSEDNADALIDRARGAGTSSPLSSATT
jgi:2-polyprenyl-6-methoxyphenol hydroxylase-like FAD-dependent oxidoreductase